MEINKTIKEITSTGSELVEDMKNEVHYNMACLREIARLNGCLTNLNSIFGFKTKMGHYITYEDFYTNSVIALPWPKERENDPLCKAIRDAFFFEEYYASKDSLMDCITIRHREPIKKLIFTDTLASFFTEIDKAILTEIRETGFQREIPSTRCLDPLTPQLLKRDKKELEELKKEIDEKIETDTLTDKELKHYNFLIQNYNNSIQRRETHIAKMDVLQSKFNIINRVSEKNNESERSK